MSPRPFPPRPRGLNGRVSFRFAAKHGNHAYGCGVERLGEFRRWLKLTGSEGRLTAANYFAWGGLYGAELRALSRLKRKDLFLSQGLDDIVAGLQDRYGREWIHEFRGDTIGFQHTKMMLIETGKKAFFRMGTAPLATIDLGVLKVGSRGLGRTELYFQTDHPDLAEEGRRCLEAFRENRFPRSGRFLLIQSPEEDGLFQQYLADLRGLVPGRSQIYHARASMEPTPSMPQHDARPIRDFYNALQEALFRGVQGWFFSDAEDGQTRRSLETFALAGGKTHRCPYVPGSQWPRGFLRVPLLGTWLQRREPSEHYNLTIFRHVTSAGSDTPRDVVYLGQKRDTPRFEGSVEAMLRLDSTTFPKLPGVLLNWLVARHGLAPVQNGPNAVSAGVS